MPITPSETGVDAKFWLDVAQWVTTALFGLYFWFSNRHKATRDEIAALAQQTQLDLKKMDERNVAMKLRITELEAEMKHLPTEQALNQLAIQLQGLHGDFRALTKELKGVRDMQDVMRGHTQLIDEFLRANR